MLGDFFTGSTMLAGDDELVSSGSVATSSARATVSAGLGVIRPVSGSADGISTVTAVVVTGPYDVLIRGRATTDGALGGVKTLHGTCHGVATCGCTWTAPTFIGAESTGVGASAATTLIVQQAIPKIPANARTNKGVRAGGVKISRFE